MLTPSIIQEAAERIVTTARPDKIILFGSYARGDANEDSDLDLVVVESELAPECVVDEMVKLRMAVGRIGVGVDILVYSGNEFEKRKDWPSTALYWAAREGKVLYERSPAGG